MNLSLPYFRDLLGVVEKKNKRNESLPSASNCSKIRNNSENISDSFQVVFPHEWVSCTWKIGCGNPVSVQRPNPTAIAQPLYIHCVGYISHYIPTISPLYPTICSLYSQLSCLVILHNFFPEPNLVPCISHSGCVSTKSKFLSDWKKIFLYVYVHIRILWWVIYPNCIPIISPLYHHACWFSHDSSIVKSPLLLVYTLSLMLSPRFT